LDSVVPTIRKGMMKIRKINYDEFLILREDDTLKAHTYYVFPEGQVGYSPDGIGIYWYESMTEAEDRHG